MSVLATTASVAAVPSSVQLAVASPRQDGRSLVRAATINPLARHLAEAPDHEARLVGTWWR